MNNGKIESSIYTSDWTDFSQAHSGFFLIFFLNGSDDRCGARSRPRVAVAVGTSVSATHWLLLHGSYLPILSQWQTLSSEKYRYELMLMDPFWAYFNDWDRSFVRPFS